MAPIEMYQSCCEHCLLEYYLMQPSYSRVQKKQNFMFHSVRRIAKKRSEISGICFLATAKVAIMIATAYSVVVWMICQAKTVTL